MSRSKSKLIAPALYRLPVNNWAWVKLCDFSRAIEELPGHAFWLYENSVIENPPHTRVFACYGKAGVIHSKRDASKVIRWRRDWMLQTIQADEIGDTPSDDLYMGFIDPDDVYLPAGWVTKHLKNRQ